MTSNLLEKQQSTTCSDLSATMDVQVSDPTNTRALFARETGQVLETLGKIFVHIPPFNDHINPDTGRMLISIGKKLRKG